MNKLTWAIIVSNEIRTGDIDDGLTCPEPEIDLMRHTTFYGDGTNVTDYCAALLGWMDGILFSDSDKFSSLNADISFCVRETVNRLGYSAANERCEKIIRAHRMADNF